MKLILSIFIISIVTLQAVSALPTDEGPIEITVKDKWTKVISDRESITGLYLFSDINNQVYSIQDTWWHMDFSAANRYAQIEKGKTYKMWFFGVRIPFLSMYQNAYRIEEP
jgi:hypothetical protein